MKPLTVGNNHLRRTTTCRKSTGRIVRAYRPKTGNSCNRQLEYWTFRSFRFRFRPSLGTEYV